MLPYFKRSETAPGRDFDYGGSSGPMLVRPPVRSGVLLDHVLRALLASGHPFSSDLNGVEQEGVGWNDSTAIDGRRQSAADAYLTPVLDRSNLRVVTGALARRLTVENGRCTGIEYTVNGDVVWEEATEEAVLAAGAVGSPHLLMVSGVGPAAHLRDVGIDDQVALPVVDPGYLTERSDLDRMVQSLRVVRRILEQKPLRHLVEKEIAPGPGVSSDDECAAYVRATLVPFFHQAGTCRMGTDVQAVVDPTLRVRGVEGLRVADASVMPTPVSANTNATVLAIAEKAVDLITKCA